MLVLCRIYINVSIDRIHGVYTMMCMVSDMIHSTNVITHPSIPPSPRGSCIRLRLIPLLTTMTRIWIRLAPIHPTILRNRISLIVKSVYHMLPRSKSSTSSQTRIYHHGRSSSGTRPQQRPGFGPILIDFGAESEHAAEEVGGARGALICAAVVRR